MNFKITLDYYSFNSNHQVPKLTRPFLLYDINADEDHYIFVNSTLCSTAMPSWWSLKQLHSKFTAT